MSIATQIAALQADKTAIATAITNKGGTVNSGDGFDDFAADIATIPTGGTKYGCTVNSFLGDVDANGKLNLPSVQINPDFSGIEDLGNCALANRFTTGSDTYGLNINPNISFSDLTDVSGVYALFNTFSTTNVATATFPKLTTVSGSNAFYYAFNTCASLTSISFPKLTTVTGNAAFNYAFDDCKSLTSVSFPELTTISGSNALNRIFNVCTGLVTARFPKLTTVTGSAALTYAFRTCQSLTDVYFNALTTTSFGSSYVNQFNNLMVSTGTKVTHTLHFPSNMETTIQGLTGYPLFGGTSGYVVLSFDLTATS